MRCVQLAVYGKNGIHQPNALINYTCADPAVLLIM